MTTTPCEFPMDPTQVTPRMTQWLRAASVLGVGLVCGSLGCEHRSVEGRAVTYSFAAWVPVLSSVAGALVILLGWLLQRHAAWSTHRRWLGVLLMVIMAPVLWLVVTPGTITDRVIIDDDHFALSTGLWWAPTRFDVRFADLKQIRVVARRSRNARNPGRVDHALLCIDRKGGETSVPIGDLMRQAAPEALARASAQGVVVLDRDRLPAQWMLTP